MITLTPETLSIGQHLAALRTASDSLLAELAALAPCLSDPNETPPDARSVQVHIRDIRHLLTRVADMVKQAYREYNRADHAAAADTLAACHATLAGELPTRLRAWLRTEPNADIRILLQDWLDSLDAIQETALC